jgi:hypothetical protein
VLRVELVRAAAGLLLEAPLERAAVARALDAPALEARRGRTVFLAAELVALGEAGVVVSGIWRGLLLVVFPPGRNRWVRPFYASGTIGQ